MSNNKDGFFDGELLSKGGLFCKPVIMDAVCSSGSKCFRETSYLFTDEVGNPIPGDACILNCRVSGLNIFDSERTNGCFRLVGKYLVRVIFENPTTGDIGVVEKKVKFTVQIPAREIDGGCVLCGDQTTEICIIPTKFHCLEACLEFEDGVPRIRVVVEKEFFAAETGRSIVCIPACPTEACIDIPDIIAGVECPACFEDDPLCDDWCAEDEEDTPGNCDQCPPPQVNDDDID